MRKPIELALLLALAAAPAVAAPELAELRAQEAGVALVRGDVGKAIELYGAALSETGLTNERRALILRWVLLLVSVAALLGILAWHYAVIFDLRSATILSSF